MRKELKIELQRQKALSLYQARKLAELEPVCRKILAMDKGDVNAMHMLGLSFRAQGKRKEACKYLCKAAAAAPNNKIMVATAANELFSLEKFESAIGLYTKLLAFEPDSVPVHNNIGFCHYALGKFDDAIKLYKQALQIDPDSAHALNNLGIVFLELGKKQIAERLFKKAIAIDPGFHQAHYHQHLAVFREQNPADAIDALCSAVTLNPQNLLAKAYLAMWLDLAGKSNEARTLFHEIESITDQLSFMIDSWEYVTSQRTGDTRFFAVSFDALRQAFSKTMDEGLILEFGVRQGNSINFISRQTKSTVHGFDSFEGLPEDWEGMKEGLYTTNSILPAVNSNVKLHKGWFKDTLPAFCEANKGNVRFMNVDCDIYSSTKTIFENLGARLVPGSVIIFDEYICNPSWRNDEYKAFQELVNENRLRYEYLLFSPFTKQAAVIIQ